MTEKEIKDLLLSVNAIENGHFLLSSGKHSDTYIQCARLFERPTLAEIITRELTLKMQKISRVDLVIGPAMGAIHLAYEMARILGVRNIFAERENGKMMFRRGFDIAASEKVVIVEDVITTGKSIKEVISLVENKGGEIIAIMSLINRTTTVISDYEYFYTLKINANTYEKETCPLCENNIPLIKPGSRISP